MKTLFISLALILSYSSLCQGQYRPWHSPPVLSADFTPYYHPPLHWQIPSMGARNYHLQGTASIEMVFESQRQWIELYNNLDREIKKSRNAIDWYYQELEKLDRDDHQGRRELFDKAMDKIFERSY